MNNVIEWMKVNILQNHDVHLYIVCVVIALAVFSVVAIILDTATELKRSKERRERESRS